MTEFITVITYSILAQKPYGNGLPVIYSLKNIRPGCEYLTRLYWVSNTHQPLEIEKAKKKVFVSFDYENDKHYKFLLQAWDANPNFDFYFSDLSSQEINSLSIPVVKQKLSQKINEATYTLVIVGKEANKQHKDHKDIGYKNWLNYEIAKSKEHKNKLVGVKIDRTYDSPEQLLNSGASWAMSFTQDAIIKALNDAAS